MTPPMVTELELVDLQHEYAKQGEDKRVLRLAAAYERTLGLLERVRAFMRDGDIALRLNRESDAEELIQLRADAIKALKEAGRDA